jgi:hypothetical protein
VDDEENTVGRGDVTLTGLDLSYRLFLANNRRLLLRTEYFGYRPNDFCGGIRKARGYYGLGQLPLSIRDDIGFLYERLRLPQAPGRA